MVGRPLHSEEVELIQALLCAAPSCPKPELDRNSCVVQMDDGGMGSIRFVYPDTQPMAKAINEALYEDIDGVQVSINLNIDKGGRLLELDFWKVDFSPLKRYPQPGDLRFESGEMRGNADGGR